MAPLTESVLEIPVQKNAALLWAVGRKTKECQSSQSMGAVVNLTR